MIRILGFDLDQTLYPKSPEIDEAIQSYLYERIAQHRDVSLEEARGLFRQYYPQFSGSKTLEKLGVQGGHDLVQEALEKADIARFLHPSPEIEQMLQRLRKKYGSLTLITGSEEKVALKKFEKIEISPDLFEYKIMGNKSKFTGEAYLDWLDYFKHRNPSLEPKNFLYIGDRYSSDVEVPQRMGIEGWLVNVSTSKPELQTKQFASVLDIEKEL